MLLSLSWLREFVPYEGTAVALAERLTMLGLEVEGIERPYEALSPLVVGYVAECGKHPEADKLSVCKVDVGTGELLDIVCGAPNVAQGQKVAVITVGNTLPDGTVIKKAKLRGQPSCGMICSERELGLSEDHDGIMVLDEATPTGARLVDVLPLDHEIIEISITPNRGDALSVLGIAREVALAYDLPLTMPECPLEECSQKAAEAVTVEVPNPALAPLYLGRVLEGAKVGKAPAWMRYRLKACGIRPISNLVDVTNYILLELGQPLHAFDLDTIDEGRIIVRGADAGETFVTLDGKERTLLADDITIRDPNKAVCLGGVMGGLNSEISAASRRVFLEGAIFAPANIRKTARRLGLSSEASFRFERGVDQHGSRFALNRAAYLMARTAGASVYQGFAGDEFAPLNLAPISWSLPKAEALLGVGLSADFCEKTLGGLNCAIEKKTADQWLVIPPAARTDITREADLVEELARVYGVDKIPATVPAIARPLEKAGQPRSKYAFLSGIKHWLAGQGGLNEAICYSFTSSKALDLFGLPQEGRIALQNPLSEDLDVLRTSLAPGLMRVVGVSLDQGATAVRLFEVAHTFTADSASETKASESAHLAMTMTGSRADQPWATQKGDMGYEDLKGVVEAFLASLGLGGIGFALAPDAAPYLLPAVAVSHKGRDFGVMGRIRPEIADTFNARKDVWYAELDLEYLKDISQDYVPNFAPLPVYPPVRRDITFICPPALKAETIVQGVMALSIPILRDVALIDAFSPEGKDERNLTFRLTFRSDSRTLKENEADRQRDVIIQKLVAQLGVQV